jgi:hypothetical protein
MPSSVVRAIDLGPVKSKQLDISTCFPVPVEAVAFLLSCKCSKCKL